MRQNRLIKITPQNHSGLCCNRGLRGLALPAAGVLTNRLRCLLCWFVTIMHPSIASNTALRSHSADHTMRIFGLPNTPADKITSLLTSSTSGSELLPTRYSTPTAVEPSRMILLAVASWITSRLLAHAPVPQHAPVLCQLNPNTDSRAAAHCLSTTSPALPKTSNTSPQAALLTSVHGHAIIEQPGPIEHLPLRSHLSLQKRPTISQANEYTLL